MLLHDEISHGEEQQGDESVNSIGYPNTMIYLKHLNSLTLMVEKWKFATLQVRDKGVPLSYHCATDVSSLAGDI